ncbi:RHS repeat-associated core domain-containing protein [Pseudomonas sp. NFX98]|uniref:RHS repeat-associated core domain-containing protein n=1 Tax=Pseudomonas sp. NFX98 TaxID=3399122 RepID=UPI0039FCA154
MSSQKTVLCRYRYDALDQLVGREPADQEKTPRFYCREHLATQLAGQVSESLFQSGTQLLAEQRREGAYPQSRLLATDQQRSVLLLTHQGRPVWQAFTPYGHRRVKSGLGSLPAINGEVMDSVTGHYLLGNGHRSFNPVLMRFNSPDSLSPFGRGGLNPYAYCLGDPVNFSDSSGRFARIITSLFSVANARIVMSPSIPYKLGKDALQWGAVGQLSIKQTVGATGAALAGITTMAAAVTGVGAAVAAINKDTEAAANFGFIALGLGAVTFTARMGSFWAARDPKTIPALKQFVESKGRVKTTEPISPRASRASKDFAPPALSVTPEAVTFYRSGHAFKRKYDGTLIEINRRAYLTATRKNVRQSTDL